MRMCITNSNPTTSSRCLIFRLHLFHFIYLKPKLNKTKQNPEYHTECCWAYEGRVYRHTFVYICITRRQWTVRKWEGHWHGGFNPSTWVNCPPCPLAAPWKHTRVLQVYLPDFNFLHHNYYKRFSHPKRFCPPHSPHLLFMFLSYSFP